MVPGRLRYLFSKPFNQIAFGLREQRASWRQQEQSRPQLTSGEVSDGGRRSWATTRFRRWPGERPGRLQTPGLSRHYEAKGPRASANNQVRSRREQASCNQPHVVSTVLPVSSTRSSSQRNSNRKTPTGDVGLKDHGEHCRSLVAKGKKQRSTPSQSATSSHPPTQYVSALSFSSYFNFPSSFQGHGDVPRRGQSITLGLCVGPTEAWMLPMDTLPGGWGLHHCPEDVPRDLRGPVLSDGQGEQCSGCSPRRCRAGRHDWALQRSATPPAQGSLQRPADARSSVHLTPEPSAL